jgi:enediyne biosynthesis protein E7
VMPTQLPPGPTQDFTVRDVQRDALGFLTQVIGEHGDLVHYTVDGRAVVLVNHPDLVRHVLQDHSKHYVKAGTPDMYMLKPMLGDGLLTTDGEAWLRLRRMAQPGFHRERIEGFAGLISERTRAMIDDWRAHADTPLDITDHMTGLTTRIVAQALFGVDITDAVEAFGRAVQAMNEFMGSFDPTNRDGFMKFQRAKASVDALVHRIIDDRRAADDGGHDFLAMLLAARDENDEPLGTRPIRDQVMTLLMAGHETTAKALTWTLYLLDRHPDVRAALGDEVQRACGGRLPALEDAARLPLTWMVLQESMRLYPPVWIMARMTARDDEMRGYHIPAGTSIIISPYAIHRRADEYPDPERFDPWRFEAERNEQRHPFAYLPFSAGPRQCIGRHFAALEMQLALAQIVDRVDIRIEPDARVEPEALVTLRPRYGMPARVRVRA